MVPSKVKVLVLEEEEAVVIGRDTDKGGGGGNIIQTVSCCGFRDFDEQFGHELTVEWLSRVVAGFNAQHVTRNPQLYVYPIR